MSKICVVRSYAVRRIFNSKGEMNMSILKWLLVLTDLLWIVVTISALLNPTIKSLIPLIVCSTSVIIGVMVVKND